MFLVPLSKPTQLPPAVIERRASEVQQNNMANLQQRRGSQVHFLIFFGFAPSLWNEPKIKMIISASAQPMHLNFGMAKDTDNIFHCTKNRVSRCCVGGDMATLFFSFFQKGVERTICFFIFKKSYTIFSQPLLKYRIE